MDSRRQHRFVAWLTDRHTLRMGTAGFFLTLAALFVASRIASASAPQQTANALISPITPPISVSVGCGDGWNPDCHPTATPGSVARLLTSFYIDRRPVGPANVVYTNVCVKYHLDDGFHSAMVVAADSLHNVGRDVSYQAIKCDTTAPFVTVGVSNAGGKVRLSPFAYDRWSGVATQKLVVDGLGAAWQSYSDACRQLSLSRGVHKVTATATDKVGNMRSVKASFACGRFHSNDD